MKHAVPAVFLAVIVAGAAHAQAGGAPPADAPAADAAPAPAVRVPSSELRAEIDRLRTSNRLLQQKSDELAAEIARVKSRLAEVDPDGTLAAAACAERGTGCGAAGADAAAAD